MTPTILDTAQAVHEATGLEPLTPRWEATLRAFYGLPLRDIDRENLLVATRRTSPSLASLLGRPKRELWCRVGRRGRKSFTAALIAVHEAAFGGHEAHTIHGERGLIAIASKDSAGSNLVAGFGEIHAKALGFKTNWSSIGNIRILELEGLPFAIACFPCSAKAPRGWAIPVVIADEIAHWATESDEYVNSDEAVLGAIKPAMAQFPDSKFIAISSPLGEVGLHYETVEQNLGDDADPNVLAVEGPTWEWNPEITEARTHEIERDPETHAREFGAKPSGNEGTAFVRSDVALCYRPEESYYAFGRPLMALDPASSGNTFTYLLARIGEPDRTPRYRPLYGPPGSGCEFLTIGVARDSFGCPIPIPIAERPLLQVFRVGGWSGDELRRTGMDAVAAELWHIASEADADTIFSDQHGDVFLAALIAQASKGRARFRSFHQTQASKHESVTYLRALMRDRQIIITPHAQMRTDLETYPRRVSGGGFKYGTARSGHHWDYASALVIMGHALIEQPQGTELTNVHYHIDQSPARRFVAGRTMTAR